VVTGSRSGLGFVPQALTRSGPLVVPGVVVACGDTASDREDLTYVAHPVRAVSHRSKGLEPELVVVFEQHDLLLTHAGLR
jgi:hypothetical protein